MWTAPEEWHLRSDTWGYHLASAHILYTPASAWLCTRKNNTDKQTNFSCSKTRAKMECMERGYEPPRCARQGPGGSNMDTASYMGQHKIRPSLLMPGSTRPPDIWLQAHLSPGKGMLGIPVVFTLSLTYLQAFVGLFPPATAQYPLYPDSRQASPPPPRGLCSGESFGKRQLVPHSPI